MAKGSLADWVGLGIAFLGIASAVVQYAINSRRSRAIKAADEIENFSTMTKAQKLSCALLIGRALISRSETKPEH